jgi:hypothetical protein
MNINLFAFKYMMLHNVVYKWNVKTTIVVDSKDTYSKYSKQ